MIVILDSGVLALIASSIKNTSVEEDLEVHQCTEWFYYLLSKGVYVLTSDICYYEVRRKLVHIRSKSTVVLDELRDVFDFLPLTPMLVKKATELWAEARWNHEPAEGNETLDADMIISAQWFILNEAYPGRAVLIATKNIRHMKIFAKEQAVEWNSIRV